MENGLKNVLTIGALDSASIQSLEDTLTQFEIKKEPKSNQLWDLLNGYTKDLLLNLSEENNIEVRKSWNKGKMVDYIEDHILNTLEESIQELEDRQLKLFKKYVADDFTSEAEEIEFFTKGYPELVKLGFIFTLKNEETISTYIPAELNEMLSAENENELSENVQEDTEEENQIEEAVEKKESVKASQMNNARQTRVSRPSYRQNTKQEPIRVEKIGRNEPCHCGSGKKYKKCCLKKDRQEQKENRIVNQTLNMLNN